MKKLIFRASLILASYVFISISMYGQDCFIQPQFIDPVECQGDSIMTVIIHLEPEETSDSFDVESNHFDIGRFAYDDLPVMVDIPLSGDMYEVLFYYDVQDTTCIAAQEIMPTCDGGPCGLTPIELSDISCLSDSTYLVTIDFGYHPDQDSFALGNGYEHFGSYEYTDLPITVELELSGDEKEYLRVVDFNDNYNCVRAIQYEVSCEGDYCGLGQLHLSDFECPTDSTYLVTIDFDYANTSDSFELSTRDWVIGTYAYSELPLRLEVGLSGLAEELLRATDVEEGFCDAEVEFEVKCGEEECEIGDIEVSNIECIDEATYWVTIDFDYSGVQHDNFDVHTRDSRVGYFAYEDLPIRFQVPISGHDYEFLRINDNDNPDCDAAVEFMVDCGSSGQNCFIQPQFIDPVECQGDSIMTVIIHLEPEETSDSFDVESNHFDIGRFAYDDLPVMVDIPLSRDMYEVLFYYDVQDTTCIAAQEIMPTCDGGPCGLTPIELSDISCLSDSTYLVTIDFGYHPDQDSFALGNGYEHFGSYEYTDLPITVELELSGDEKEYLRVVDFNDNYNCVRAIQYEVNCQVSNCDLGQLHVSNIECPTDSTYLVTIDFDYANTSDSFELSTRDWVIGTYAYAELPLRLEVELSGLPDELLRATDVEDENCETATEFEVDCVGEECEIGEIEVSHIECIDETTYWVTIDFGYSGVQHTHFDVHTRDSLVGYFAYEDLPIRFQVPISGHDYEFLRINDNDNPDCDAAVEFMVDCETSSTTNYTSEDIDVFPNPASSKIHLSTETNWTGIFVLQDLSGRIVREGRERSNDAIDVSNLTDGLYFLKLEFADGSWIAKKIIIQSH